jgi:Tfp pilus assembly protein PilN
VEVFGRSATRATFSAQFDAPAERAAAVAAAELRLSADTVPVNLEQVLPAPRVNPVEHDLSRDALAYATALAGACPLVARAANLLPPERRVSSSRTVFLPTVVLAAVLVLVAGAMLAYAAYSDGRYLRQLQAEIARLEPQAKRAAALDRETEALRARMRLLDDFRGHTHADLDALNELTRLLAPPVWTSSIDLTRDGASLAGEAPQASGLIKIIDASPLFENSDFSVIARSQSAELFRIRTNRRGRK